MISVVYFIQSIEGPVKIGWSADLERRRANLATASGLGTVLATIAGGEDLEAHFHEMLAPYRLHGEWFKADPPVLALAEAIRLGQYVPPIGFKHLSGGRNRVRFVLADAIEATKDEARDLVQKIAGPMALGQKNEHAWRRVEHLTGVPKKRVKTLWYREAHVINAAELDRLRTVYVSLSSDSRPSSELEARLAACEAALGLQNADADGSMADASSRPPRVAHRPLAR